MHDPDLAKERRVTEIRFRDASPEDADAVVAIVAAAFGFDAGSDRWRHVEEAYHSPTHHWRLGERDGRVVAALYVARSRLRVGQGYLVKGDVGDVAVDPLLHGQGVGTAMMQDTVAWMRRQDYDISRLGGLVRFYSRFGYEPFVRRYVEFYLRPGVGAGAATAHPAYLEEPAQSHVYPLEAADWPQCRAIDEECNAWRTGAFLDGGGGSPPAQALVFREGDQVQAWLSLVEHPIDRTEFESRLTIGGGAWRRGRADALAALVAHVLRLGHARGHDHISARLPFDTELFTALTAAELPYKAVELHEAAAATMVQVLNLRSLFEHLLPELERRWRAADLCLNDTITVIVGEQQVTLALRPASLAIGAGPVARRVVLACPAMVAMALGLQAPSYLLGGAVLPPDTRTALLLGVLFPQQLATSGTWG